MMNRQMLDGHGEEARICLNDLDQPFVDVLIYM